MQARLGIHESRSNWGSVCPRGNVSPGKYVFLYHRLQLAFILPSMF